MSLRALDLRVEYLDNPLGIDVTKPRLSWKMAGLNGAARGDKQTAYRILVASTQAKINADKGDLWDTARVDSEQSIHVAYAGMPLKSRTECWWKVCLWDQKGEQGPFSDAALWTMGLLDQTDWRAAWIGFGDPLVTDVKETDFLTVDGCKWCVCGGEPSKQDAPVIIGYRGRFDSPPASKVVRIQLVMCCGGQFEAFLNGDRIAVSDDHYFVWQRPVRVDLTQRLRPGPNIVAVKETFAAGPAPGIIGAVVVDYANGSTERVPISPAWKTNMFPIGEWSAAEFDDKDWAQCTETVAPGEAPWGYLASAPREIPPCPCLRREFDGRHGIRRARIYASALGLYELRINGRKVGEDLFRPGWTDYFKRIPYQTYDVTKWVRAGTNAIGVILGHGWYSGYLGWATLQRGQYGQNPRALVQLEIDYEDGSTQTVTTNAAWKAAHGPIIGADFLMGEQYDARRELPGWDSPGYDDSEWRDVTVDEGPACPLCAHPGVPVRVFHEIRPLSVREAEPAAYIFDMGQNMVGWVRLCVNGPSGAKVTLRFGEALKSDGRLYVENIRGARAEDEYWLAGTGQEVWEPRFTFHGFRYVEVRGYPGAGPELDAITGVVVTSDTPLAGKFECSEPILNQLQSNISWGLRGNFLEVPTDCPQRDERQGWTGDAQVFAPTACFNVNAGAFYTKWMQDVADGQTPEGAFPDIAPNVPALGIKPGSPGYGDVGVTVPWAVYQSCGDVRILETHYAAMRKWVDFLASSNPNHLWLENRGCDHGDWLSLGETTPKEVVATVYFAHTTRLLAKIAAILGKESEAKTYSALADAIRDAFIKAYVKQDGRIHGNTQGAYILALRYGLVPENLRNAAAERLIERIKEQDWHLVAGFMGCPCALFALAETGHDDVAYRLLMNDTFPSWAYSIRQGATTIWERWNGWTREHGFQDPAMNSFNHYAFGSVGEWMYRHIAGINIDTQAPGYKHVVIRPRPGGRLRHARAEHESMYGRIVSDWRIEASAFKLRVVIPPNASATVHLPTSGSASIMESGKPVADAEGIQVARSPEGEVEITIGSGEYAFECLLENSEIA